MQQSECEEVVPESTQATEPLKEALLEAFPTLPETVEVDLPLADGRTLFFKARTVRDSTERESISARCEEVCEVIEKGMVPPAWKRWLPCSRMLAQACFYVSELVVEPKITMPEALEWAKTRDPLIPTLWLRLHERVLSPVLVAEVERVMAKKNSSNETPMGGPS